MAAEILEDGKRVGKLHSVVLGVWAKHIHALWIRSLTDDSAGTPPKPKELEAPKETQTQPDAIELITADQARKMRKVLIDDAIARFNSEIEAAVVERKNTNYLFKFEDNGVRKEFQALLKKAGYEVSYSKMATAFTVSWV